MERIRILFTIPNFISAGSGREMFNIIERLDTREFEPFIAVQQTGGTIYCEAQEKGYPILTQPYLIPQPSGFRHIILSARNLAKEYKQYHFDIWQSFNWSSEYTEPLVARFAGAKFYYVKKNMNWNRAAWKIKSLLSSGIIARNHTLTETVLSHWLYRRKTTLITGGVDIHKFRPGIISDIKAKLGIPSGVKLVTCVAQIVRSKNQGVLIKAIQQLDNVVLLLAGAERDETYARELKTLVANLGLNHRVLFAGNVSEVNDLLNASDVFVLPTSTFGGHEEGSPVSLLEAMAAGVPTIAGNVAGIRDLVIHEKTGLMFDPDDAGELAKCIKRYFDDNSFASEMAATAMEKVHESHTLEKEAAAFSRLYKQSVRY